MTPDSESAREEKIPEWRRNRVRISAGDLTPEAMRTIIETYYRSTGAGERAFDDPEIEMYLDNTREMLERGRWAEWRFGSRLSPHSKLWIERTQGPGDTLEIYVDPNMDRGDRDEEKDQLRQDFYEALTAALDR